MNSVNNSIRSGAKWLFIGNTGSQVLTFLFGIVLARLLMPEDFGMLVTIQVFTGVAGLIAGGGMGQALVRAKTTTKQDYDIVFTLQIIIGCCIYAAFYFAAPWLADWYNTPLYADLLRVSALSFIFRPFVNLPANLLHRAMRFKALSIVRIITLTISSTVSITMAYAGYGVWSLIIGGIAASIANALLFALLAKWRPGLSRDFRQGRDIARYGLLVLITDILDYLRSQVSVFVLSRTLGPASVGLYNKGSSMARMPHTFITGSIYQVLFRAMAAEQDNLDKCRYLFFRGLSLVAVYATPFYIGFIWLAEPLIRGLYGEKWLDAAGPLVVLSFAWPFWLLGNLSGAVLAAKNWLNREVLVQVSTLIIACLAVLIGLDYGIRGVAYAIVFTAIYNGLHLHWLALSSLRARWSAVIRAFYPAVIMNVILAVALLIVDNLMPDEARAVDLLYLSCMTVIGAFIYGLCFLYLPFPSLLDEQKRWKTRLRIINDQNAL